MSKIKVKFNGMDLFIILVVLAVIAAAAVLLLGGSGGGAVSASKNVNVTATVELTTKDASFAELIKEGDIVLMGEKDKMEAVVSAVEVVPAKSTGYDILEGGVIRAEIPGEYDVRVSMTALGADTEKAIEINGVAIRVGQNMVLGSKNWAGEGYVIGLETEDAQ